jgi:hypothetical protein
MISFQWRMFQIVILMKFQDKHNIHVRIMTLNNLFKFNVTLLAYCQRLRSLPQANTFYIVYILCTTRFTWSGGDNSNTINMTVPTSGAGSAFLTKYLRVHRQKSVVLGSSIFDFLWCFALSILIRAFYLRTLIIPFDVFKLF